MGEKKYSREEKSRTRRRAPGDKVLIDSNTFFRSRQRYVYSCFEKGCATKPCATMPKGIMGNGGLWYLLEVLGV